MVSAHCWMKPYSARDVAKGASMHVRYLKREGEFAPGAYAERTSEKTKDYDDYVTGNVRNLPAWAAGDASRFFTQAARSERVNGYYAFQVEFSLPRELTREQQLMLAHDVMDATMPDLPALWAMHEKRLKDGEMHPHIHVLFSARRMDGVARGPEQMFKRWDRRQPHRGGCEKDLFWSQRQAPEQLRQAFADMTNYHLERAGAVERLDPRALKRRGSQRPAIRWDHSERPNAATLARERAQAQEAWEQRKAYKDLGDMQGLSREEFVLLVRQWTRDYERGQELPRSSREVVVTWQAREEQRLRHHITALAGYQHRVQQARRVVTTYQQRGLEPPLSVQQGTERVLAEGRQHELPPDLATERAVRETRLPRFGEELVLPDGLEEHSGGRAARVRIWDERRSREERDERRRDDER